MTKWHRNYNWVVVIKPLYFNFDVIKNHIKMVLKTLHFFSHQTFAHFFSIAKILKKWLNYWPTSVSILSRSLAICKVFMLGLRNSHFFTRVYFSYVLAVSCKNLVKNGCLLIMKVVGNHQEGSTAIIRFSVRVIFWTCSNLAVVNKLHWIHNREKNETRQTGKQTAEFFKEFFALISLVHFATGKNLQRSSVKNIFLYLHTMLDFT